jgi:predicted nucleotidyltransferase component of viral defense system
MLFSLWAESPHRPTRDLDLLGFGEPSSDGLAAIFQNLCSLTVEPDGLTFDSDSVHVSEIREGQTYLGLRVKLVARLGTARIPVQVDIGFGDTVIPEATEIDYPTLLELPAPRIRAYPPETVVAEKLQAMVALGMQNSRMRDFYDLWTIARNFSFEGATLVTAVRATFDRRLTAIPQALPTALSDEFATDEHKKNQWKGFLARSQLESTDVELTQVIDQLRAFLMPVLEAAANKNDFAYIWGSGGPWLTGR